MPMTANERLLAALLPFLLVAGCQRASDSSEGHARHPPPLEGVALDVAQTHEPTVPASPADALPPTVARNQDGTVVVTGVDRWGQQFSTTYETVDYLERALPALERALSPANFIELGLRVKELR